MAPLTRRAWWRSESGAELVEFALVLPLLLIMIGGIIDMARLFQGYEVTTNAAREGARLAVLPGYDVGGYAAVQTRVAAYLTAGGATGAHATTVTPVSVSLGNGVTSAAVRVSVTYTQDFLLVGPLLGLIGGTFADTLTYQTSSVMRSEIQVPVGGGG